MKFHIREIPFCVVAKLKIIQLNLPCTLLAIANKTGRVGFFNLSIFIRKKINIEYFIISLFHLYSYGSFSAFWTEG